MEQLTIFEYNGVSVGVYGKKHNPWFSGVDVAQALGYNDPMWALSRYVDMDDKTIDSPISLINEYGLYTLISNSNNVLAKRCFVNSVLPQIHKSGKYKEKSAETRKKYVRLYELSNGEKLSKVELSKKALSLGMSKSNANSSSVVKLINYIESTEKKILEKKMLEEAQEEYPYSYDDVEEISQYNLSCLMHILPEGSHKTICGVSRFNDEAVEAIKNELSKWK